MFCDPMPPSALPGANELREHPAWVGNPWDAWDSRLPRPGGAILLLGTGLSTVDAVLTLRALGWQDRQTPGGRGRFTFPQTTLGALAADIQRRMNIRALRVVGDPNAKVSSAAVGMGFGMPRVTPDVDVVIGGENPESGGQFDDTEYVLDAAYFGRNKGQIILGHAISEEAGMEDCANWLRTFVTEVPIQFIRAGEPFWSPKA